MSTRSVFRYEHPETGKGPYNTVEGLNADHHVDTHPSWLYDGLSSCAFPRHSSYLSGCKSLEALRSWFEGWEDKLAADGFEIVVYIVPNTAVKYGLSRKQLAFDSTEVISRK